MDTYMNRGPRRPTRRAFLRQAAATGMIAAPASGMVAGCATSGDSATTNAKNSDGDGRGGRRSKKNPFGVDPAAPLDVAAFNGGTGYQWNKNDGKVYSKEYPDSDVTVKGLQQMSQKLQPKFVGGDPPDVFSNSGAGNLDVATLIAHNQIADLSDLYDAPSYDTPGKTVKETLRPGVVGSGEFGGKPYILNYVYTVWGLWHSSSLFEKQGWEYPKTWDEMISLCAKIKKTTDMAPWTYQGKYPSYILNPILSSAIKLGGMEVVKNIDNLEPNAWKQDAVKQAATAYHELPAKGYVLPGTPGLTHIQSQTKWSQGKAVFIPCGTWLRNEARSTTPKGFDMVINPTPSLTKSDKMPYEAAWQGAATPFAVPAQASNVPGGKEYLRIMLSKQQSQDFSNLVDELTSTADYAEDTNFGTAVSSALKMSNAAGNQSLQWKFATWYAKMEADVENATHSLMSPGGISPSEWTKRCQKAADDTAKNDSIKKYHR